MDPKRVQLRRGNTDQMHRFIGLPGEVTVDTDKWTVVVHDGTTPGGHPLRLDAQEYVRVKYLMFRAAITQGGSAVLAFSTADHSPAPVAVQITEGKNMDIVTGAAAFSYGTAQSIQDHFMLPSDFIGPLGLDILWRTTSTVGNVGWQVETCGVPTHGVLGTASFNPPQLVDGIRSGTPEELITTSIDDLDVTGLMPEGEVFFRLTRHPNDTLIVDAQLIALRFRISTQSK